MNAPDTVTEAVAFLASKGYVDDFRLAAEGIVDSGTSEVHPRESAVVDYTFRFEGESDPGDEAIVLGVRCGGGGRKGVVVSAYGPDADPEHTALLVALTRSADQRRVVVASRDIGASPEKVFELIADPARQPAWDGNDNLADAAPGQRVRGVGDVFAMTTTKGSVRENHVVEFEEGRLIAWKPAEPGQPPVGHVWRWQVDPVDEARSRVTHTYDWTDMHDASRLERARSTTTDRLMASLDRLAALAEEA